MYIYIYIYKYICIPLIHPTAHNLPNFIGTPCQTPPATASSHCPPRPPAFHTTLHITTTGRCF